MHNLLQNEKDIDTIFFYAINGNINYLTLFYTANNIKYKVDYKDINFKEIVERLIKVYNTLKNEKNIKLMGDLTKEILDGKVKFNSTIYNETLLNTNNYDYISIISYIKLIIEHTFKTLNINSELKYKDNKFSYLNYRTVNPTNPVINYGETEEFQIPITFYKTSNGYKLKYKLLKCEKEYIFDTEINIYDKRIIVNIKNNLYNGEIIFDKLNIDNTIRFKKNNSLVHFYNIENNLTDDDINLINNIFKLINFNQEINGIKTIDNNYLLYNSDSNQEYNMHLNIHSDVIRIRFKQLKKYKKDNIDFKVEEEKYDYLITKYNDKYILVQQKFLLTNNSNYEYKKNINKSKYYILESDEKIINIKDANIVKIEEIFVDKLDNIKRLIRK